MRMIAVTYGKVLLELGISKDSVRESQRILRENPILIETFGNPRVSMEEKGRVITSVFPEEMHKFFKTALMNQDMDCMIDAFSVWEEINREKENAILATYRYVTKPNEKQVSRIKEYLKREYQTNNVDLHLIEDVSILGGFILQVKDKVIDRSTRGRLRSMGQNLHGGENR